MVKKVNILAFNGSYSSSITNMADVLESANLAARSYWEVEESPFEWRLMSLDGEQVHCSNGLSISVHAKAEPPPPATLQVPYQPEILLLAVPYMPGLGSADMSKWTDGIAWLKANHHHYAQIVTHCFGTFLLAEAGLLDGLQATTSWWMVKDFVARYPQVELIADKRYIETQRFILGGATGCYQDVALHFVEQHCGADIARILAKYMLIDKGHVNQMVYSIDLPFSSKNPVILRAQQWIASNLDKSISVAEVADNAAVTTRTLARHFQKDLGYSPQTHIQKLRIEKSKVLLEATSLRLNEIAMRCGYSDESAFRRLFKKHCDVSPNAFRKLFQFT